MERHKIIAFFPLGARLGQSSVQCRTRPDVAERVGGIRVERSSGGPDGQEQLEEGLPQQGEGQLGRCLA